MKKIIFFLLSIFFSTMTIQKKNKKNAKTIKSKKINKKYNHKIFKIRIPLNTTTQNISIEKLQKELESLKKEEILLKDKLNSIEILKKNKETEIIDFKNKEINNEIEKKISKEQNESPKEAEPIKTIKEENNIEVKKINNLETLDDEYDSDEDEEE